MPASTTDSRNTWKKRKRDSLTSPQYDAVHQQEQDLQDDDQISPKFHENLTNSNPNNPLTHPITPELLSDTPIRVSEFPPVVKHNVKRPHSSVTAIVNAERGNGSMCGVSLENVSYGQLQALSAMSKESLVENGEGGCVPYVLTPPKIREGQGVVKRFGNDQSLVVPMHADWFSPNTVHRLERQVVPRYFSGKSADHTPKKYMECRNYIVAKYMGNPDKRLAMSDCDDLVIGVDSDDLNRIFRFLDHWGIINYCVPALNLRIQNGGLCLNEDTNGELCVPMNLLKSIDSLIQFDKPKCQLSVAEAYLEPRGDSNCDLDNKIQERLSEKWCSSCCRPLSIIFYQSQKEAEVLLCMECFHEGRFVAGHSSLDFSRFDSSKDYGDLGGKNWSNQENLLLLEAIEVYGDNWNEIADHVKTKSKAQCIIHFLRFPMDDSSMKNVEVPHIPISVILSNNDECGRSYSNSNSHHAGYTQQDPNAESRIPFANYANPVMALVAFLASALGPRVAAAFAHATLIELLKDDQVAVSDYNNVTNTSQQKESTPLSDAKLRAAIKAGLSAAATKAKLFADHEEREIQRFSANIINYQGNKR